MVQSVTRAFDVLNVLRDAAAPPSVQEIAQITGLDRTVVHRLLKSLLQESMVLEDRGRFRVGPASTLLANRYIDDLLVRRIALPYMVELHATQLNGQPWTATLLIAVGNVMTVIERIWTAHTPLDLVLNVGDSFPIDRSAAGRSILAYYPPGLVAATIGAERAAELAPVLDAVRSAGGLGLSRGEAVPGVQAIAAVILSRRHSPVAAISVSGVDLGDHMDPESSLASTLRRAALAIGQMIP